MNSVFHYNDITPEIALQLLIEGNERFVRGLSINRDLMQKVKETKDMQKPYAAILSCMDSRAPAELLFDQGIGDIFNIRIAGNVVSPYVLGSLEYAVAVAGSKLILVMGHTNCGAVKGACDGVEMGHLTGLLGEIRDAVDKEAICNGGKGTGDDWINKVSLRNVYHSIDKILEQSDIIRSYVEDGKILIVPAMYNIATGITTFYRGEDNVVGVNLDAQPVLESVLPGNGKHILNS